LGRIGVEWRSTNGHSQRSRAVLFLPMFVFRVVWSSPFFQISSLVTTCCFIYPHSSYSEQLYVGVLLTTQPFFILGIEDVSEARSNAFGAMGMFMATFVLSLYGILRSRSAKEDIDNADGYQLSEFGSSRYD